MRTRLSILLMTLVALMGIPSTGLAISPGSVQHDADSASLRDAADDILLSDGNATYTGKDISSTRITDYSDPTDVDHFQFQAWSQKRHVQINTDYVNGGTPLTCDFDYVVFRSSTTPNWYDILTAGWQSSVLSDASFICHGEGGFGAGKLQWRVSYPDFPNECAVIERLDPTRWRFSAPPYAVDPATGTGTGCAATLTTSSKERGKETVTEQVGISAPMELTVVIP